MLLYVVVVLAVWFAVGGSVALFEGATVALVGGVIGGAIWGVIQIAWLLFMVRRDQRKLER